MKKTLALLLMVCMALSLAACGGGSAPAAAEPPATEAPATEAPATEPPVTEAPATEPPATEPPAKEEPTEKFEEIPFDEMLKTTDDITISYGSHSVTVSFPSEYELYTEFNQKYNDYALIRNDLFKYGGGRTTIGFEPKTEPVESVEKEAASVESTWESMREQMHYTDIEKSEMVTEEMNGYEVTWMKIRYYKASSTDEGSEALPDLMNTEMEFDDYIAAAKIGSYVFKVHVELSHNTFIECALDDNIIPTIFSHVTDMGA